jgi:PiT family inorganic phosphate transporter
MPDMMFFLLGLLCVGLLTCANGANDNFKGVATLFGSGVSDYRRALAWATVTTFCGSLAAIFFTAHLVATFSGKLFVDANTLATPGFALAFSAGCAATVLLATRIGAPISTTHALAGSLLGAAFATPESLVDWAKAGKSIFLPLAVGPLVAVAAALVVYPLFTRLRQWAGVQRQTCVCIGEEWVPQGQVATLAGINVRVDTIEHCRERYLGAVLGVSAQSIMDGLHYVSAGLVSFARGMNDTPKIVALTLMVAPLAKAGAFPIVGVAMAIGGLLGARRVAQTMSKKITEMNPGQGFTANLITSSLVLAASPLGLPLSTTHVSCGALFGIGAITGQAHWKTIAGILLAWVVTLPLAAGLGALFMRIMLISG